MLRCGMASAMECARCGGMPTKGRDPMILQPLLCILNRHRRPEQHKAVWDGVHYVGRCSACGREIYRRKSKTWRAIGSG